MSAKARRTSGVGEGPSKVKAACEECRTRKTKCDAVRPNCGRCVSKGRVCVYETEPDEFRITALKRRYTELAQAASNNEALIRLLREKGHDDAVQILDRLRRGETIDSILSGDDVGPEGRAELNLMAAVEEARSSDMVESGPAFATSSAGEEGSSSAVRSPRRLINKQSIAFLVEASEVERSPSAPGPHGSTLQHDTVEEGTTGEQDRHLSPRAPLEKRTRTDEPVRPVAARTTLSDPSLQRLSLSGGAGLLNRRPLSNDESWRKDLTNIKAADWEVSYTNDETFLEILRCYFIWENPSLGFVNEVAFWDGLRAGGTDFCNIALIHSILAFGSKIYGMFHPQRAEPTTKYALVEARNMWDWDADATVPANISTGMLIHAILTSNGQEKEAAPYIAGAINLATQSALFAESHISQAYPISDLKLSKERAALAWNTYAYHGYYSLTSHEAVERMSLPPVEAPAPDPSEDSKEWVPFPIQGAARPHLSCTVWHARAGLWRYGSEIVPLHKAFKNEIGSDRHWRRASELHNDLRRWREGLNPRLNTLHGAAPQVFTLHSEYHRCALDLFVPFVKAPANSINTAIQQEAWKLANESDYQLRLFVHQYDIEFPDMPVPFKMLINPTLYVVHEMVPRKDAKADTSDEAFYLDLCIKLMSRMQDAYPLMRFLILEIHGFAEKQGVALPEASRDVVEALRKTRSNSLPMYEGFGDPTTVMVEGSHVQRLVGQAQGLSLRPAGTEEGPSSRGSGKEKS